MDISKINIGDKAPEEFNVIIEISSGGLPIKYEFDKESGAIVVDRLIATPMFYPYNYGFIPHTLGRDGDPLDVLVVTEVPLMLGSVIKVRPIGCLHMEDESGMDEKILCVPTLKVSKLYEDIKSYEDLPLLKLEQVKHFFEHYKDLEPGKWVKVTGYKGVKEAIDVIKDGISRAGK